MLAHGKGGMVGVSGTDMIQTWWAEEGHLQSVLQELMHQLRWSMPSSETNDEEKGISALCSMYGGLRYKKKLSKVKRLKYV